MNFLHHTDKYIGGICSIIDENEDWCYKYRVISRHETCRHAWPKLRRRKVDCSQTAHHYHHHHDDVVDDDLDDDDDDIDDDDLDATNVRK